MIAAFAMATPAAAQQQPASAEAEPVETAPGDKLSGEGFFRRNTIGLGPGFVFWPPRSDDATDELEVAPGLSIQHRLAAPIAGVFGFEFTNDIVFHDWKAMGDAYGWYFDKTEDDTRSALRLVAWPGLILIPFGAANYTTGIGLIFWTGTKLPAMYFDVGANLNLWLRLSDPDFRADFGIGAYGGFGFDVFENFGANLRVLWGPPTVHTIINKTSAGITQIVFNINFLH